MWILGTNHEISDRVASAITQRTDMNYPDGCIGYGILRGMGDAFKREEAAGRPWIQLDRGYLKPGHYDGYYRVSLRGTQHTQGIDHDWLLDRKRLNALGIEMQPWRGFDRNERLLICPPTDAVCSFFGIKQDSWIDKAHTWAHKNRCAGIHVRFKNDMAEDIVIENYGAVYTFNSSMGWKALQAGIPCLSDHNHSLIGTIFNNPTMTIDILDNLQQCRREDAFAAMANLQLTLSEMRDGELWPLVNRLISISDGMAGKPSPPKLPPIVSGAELPSSQASST